jgi:hypothetical protein
MLLWLSAIAIAVVYYLLYLYNPPSDQYDPKDENVSFERVPDLPKDIAKQYPFNRKVIKINGLFYDCFADY